MANPFIGIRTRLEQRHADLQMQRQALEIAEKRVAAMQALDRVLTALSRDWRQPLDQLFKSRGVSRVALLKKDFDLAQGLRFPLESGKVLLWPKELIRYEDARNGLDVSCESVKKGHVLPISEALTYPCPLSGRDAYVTCDMHDDPDTYDQHMGPQMHGRLMLLCPGCESVHALHPEAYKCKRCIV